MQTSPRGRVRLITQLFTLLLYVGVSLATCRTPFNMDRLLHRGAYADEREKAGGGLNALDDGRVEGHVSLADAAEVARAESAPPEEPTP